MTFPLAEKMHQILTPEGKIVGEVPDLSPEQLLGYYRWMVTGRTLSDRMVALQRQGRLGTFGPINGQEAASVAIAAPLETEDWLTGSYRELLCYLVKGVRTVDILKYYRGRPGINFPAEQRCIPIQIVLATQMLHAAGLAMAIQYDGQPNVAVGVCGDGATSEGDFNETLNFAAVYQAPLVTVVQNNGWAISVPRSFQTRAEYIAHRGPGFGMPGYVVDGNDLLAVYQVMSDCVARARAGDGPSLVEAITYRLGAHTTADDPTKYRPPEELAHWQQLDPMVRYRQFLLDRDLMTPQEDEAVHEAVKAEIQAAVDELEALPPANPTDIFELVYETPTPQLAAQRGDLEPFLRNSDGFR